MTVKAGQPPRVVEAPSDLGDLFLRWLAAGKPGFLDWELERRLWRRRNEWLLAGDWVFYLCGEDIRIVPRSEPLPTKNDE